MFLLLLISIKVELAYVLSKLPISTSLLVEVLSLSLSFMETFSGIFETLVVFVKKNEYKRFRFLTRDEQIELIYLSQIHVTFD